MSGFSELFGQLFLGLKIIGFCKFRGHCFHGYHLTHNLPALSLHGCYHRHKIWLNVLWYSWCTEMSQTSLLCESRLLTCWWNGSINSQNTS